MDNIVNAAQLLTPQLNVQGKPLTVQIPEIPPSLSAAMRPTEPVLLNLLINSNDGSSVQAEVLLGSQKIPVELKPEQALKLEPGTAYQVVAKSTPTGNFQFLSVDGQKVENFILRPSVSVVSRPIGEVSVSRPSSPASTVALQPVKTPVLLDSLMREMKFPQALRAQVLNSLPAAEIAVAAKSLEAAPQTGENLLEPLKNTLRQIQLAGENQTPAAVKNFTLRLQQSISALEGRVFNASVVSRPSVSVAVLDSPLGPLLADTPLKLAEQMPLLLEAGKIAWAPSDKTPQPLALFKAFEEILQKSGAEKTSLRLDLQHLARAVQKNDQNVINLLKVFEPLKQLPSAPEVAARILQKLPSFNRDMLSNMHGFFKAAQNKDASVWLGREVSSLLQGQGTSGTETLARLDNYIASSLKEGQVWRLVEIPFFDGTQIIPVKIALKKNTPEKKEQKRKPSGGVRFLVDTDFSKLGQFQFDGFSLASERRFDLVIRTSRLQNEDFCLHIINLFKKSLYDVNYVGNVKINLRESFVKVDIDQPEPMKEGVYI